MNAFFYKWMLQSTCTFLFISMLHTMIILLSGRLSFESLFFCILDTFLELLEPYILRDMLGSLPPEVLLDVYCLVYPLWFFQSVANFFTVICLLFHPPILTHLKIMQALVEHYSSKGWLQRVEQCVLHMDISSLDFNQVFLNFSLVQPIRLLWFFHHEWWIIIMHCLLGCQAMPGAWIIWCLGVSFQ